MADDTSRQVATRPDSDFTLSIEQALELYTQAGLPRTPRSIQRYCAKGHLQARLVETDIGEKYLIASESVAKHIAYIQEVMAATGRDTSRSVATSRDNKIEAPQSPTVPATGDDPSRQAATSPDMSRYVARLEDENDFLRKQVDVKDKQIGELTERARETNVLIGGLQKMLSPLLSAPRNDEHNPHIGGQ